MKRQCRLHNLWFSSLFSEFGFNRQIVINFEQSEIDARVSTLAEISRERARTGNNILTMTSTYSIKIYSNINFQEKNRIVKWGSRIWANVLNTRTLYLVDSGLS